MWKLFLEDCKVRYQVIGAWREQIQLAVELAQRRKIRGCDSIQLATAILLDAKFLEQDLSLTLVAADGDLLDTAKAEGLATINPELIPESKKHD